MMAAKISWMFLLIALSQVVLIHTVTDQCHLTEQGLNQTCSTSNCEIDLYDSLVCELIPKCDEIDGTLGRICDKLDQLENTTRTPVEDISCDIIDEIQCLINESNIDINEFITLTHAELDCIETDMDNINSYIMLLKDYIRNVILKKNELELVQETQELAEEILEQVNNISCKECEPTISPQCANGGAYNDVECCCLKVAEDPMISNLACEFCSGTSLGNLFNPTTSAMEAFTFLSNNCLVDPSDCSQKIWIGAKVQGGKFYSVIDECELNCTDVTGLMTDGFQLVLALDPTGVPVYVTVDPVEMRGTVICQSFMDSVDTNELYDTSVYSMY